MTVRPETGIIAGVTITASFDMLRSLPKLLDWIVWPLAVVYTCTVPVSTSYALRGDRSLFIFIMGIVTLSLAGLLGLKLFVDFQTQNKVVIERFIFFKDLLLIAAIYLIISIGSTVFTEDPNSLDFAIQKLTIFGGMLVNTILLPIVYGGKKQVEILVRSYVGFALFMCAIFTGIFVMTGGSFDRYLYNDVGAAYGLPDWLGIAFDPNLMMFGVGFAIVLFLVYYYDRYKQINRQQWLKIAGISLPIVFFVLVINSRTAAMSMAIGMLGWFLIKMKYQKKLRQVLTFAIVMLTCFHFYTSFAVNPGVSTSSSSAPKNEVYNDLTAGREESNEDRLMRIEAIFQEWLARDKTIVLGYGYSMEAVGGKDPHNIYLSHLYGTGLLGFLAFGALIGRSFQKFANLEKNLKTSTIMILVYICIGGLTYWHIKTFWVPLMLYLAINIANYEDIQNSLQKLEDEIFASIPKVDRRSTGSKAAFKKYKKW
jgi:O-antigen ligase